MAYVFDSTANRFRSDSTNKVQMVDATVRLLSEYGVNVSPSNVIMTRVGDFVEFRCYQPIPETTTVRNKQLAATVKRNIRNGEVLVDIK